MRCCASCRTWSSLACGCSSFARCCACGALFDALGRGTLRLAGFAPDWAEPTRKRARLALGVLALVVTYPYLPGSHTEAFKGISILPGVLRSIGSSSATPTSWPAA